MGGAFYQQANSENFSSQGILKGKSAKLRPIKEEVSMCSLHVLYHCSWQNPIEVWTSRWAATFRAVCHFMSGVDDE